MTIIQPPQRNLPPDASQWAKWVEQKLSDLARTQNTTGQQLAQSNAGYRRLYSNVVDLHEVVEENREITESSQDALEGAIEGLHQGSPVPVPPTNIAVTSVPAWGSAGQPAATATVSWVESVVDTDGEKLVDPNNYEVSFNGTIMLTEGVDAGEVDEDAPEKEEVEEGEDTSEVDDEIVEDPEPVDPGDGTGQVGPGEYEIPDISEEPEEPVEDLDDVEEVEDEDEEDEEGEDEEDEDGGLTPNPNQAVVKDLSVNTEFVVRVRAVTPAGEVSEWSAPVVFTTADNPPLLDAPSKPILHSTNGELDVMWDGLLGGKAAPQHLDYVAVETRLQGTSAWTRFAQDAGWMTVGLTVGDVWEVRLVAVDTLGRDSAPSAVESITIVSAVQDALDHANEVAEELEIEKGRVQKALDDSYAAQGGVQGALQAVENLDNRVTPALAAAQNTANQAAQDLAAEKVRVQAEIDQMVSDHEAAFDGFDERMSAASDAIDEAFGKATKAESDAAAAQTKANAAAAAAAGAQNTADQASAKATTADGRYTVATANPVAADAVGKPLGAVWEVRSGGTALRRYVLTGTSTWTQVKIGQDFIGANAIGRAQIGEAAVGTLQVADGTITNLKIGEGAVDTLQVAKGAITNAKIDNLAVTNAKIAEATIETSKIKDLQVDKLTVVGGATFPTAVVDTLVGQDAFLKNVYANRMVVAPEDNLFPLFWGAGTRGAALWPSGVGWSPNTYWQPPGLSGCLYANTQVTTAYPGGVENKISVAAGEQISFEIWVRANGSGSVMFVELRDQDGALLPASAYDKHVGGSSDYLIGKYTVPETWTRHEVVVTIPTGVTSIYISNVYWNHSAGTATVTQGVAIRARRKVGSVLIENGAITAPKITASQELSAKVAQFLELETGKITWKNAAGNNAFIGSLVGQDAFFERMMTEQMVVSPGNLVPGVDTIATSNAGWTAFARNLTYPAYWLRGRQTVNTDAPIPLVEGQEYSFSCEVRTNVEGARFCIQMENFDEAGAISGAVSGSGAGAYGSYLVFNQVAGFGTFTKFSSTFKSPITGRARLRFYSMHANGTQNPDGYLWYKDVTLRKRVGAVLIENGAITAPKMQAGALDSFEITSPIFQSVKTANRGIKWIGDTITGYTNTGAKGFELVGGAATISGGTISGGTFNQVDPLDPTKSMIKISNGTISAERHEISPTSGKLQLFEKMDIFAYPHVYISMKEYGEWGYESTLNSKALFLKDIVHNLEINNGGVMLHSSVGVGADEVSRSWWNILTNHVGSLNGKSIWAGDPLNLAPDLGSNPEAWRLGSSCKAVFTTASTTGVQLEIQGSGSIASRQAWGPMVPVQEGDLISFSMRFSFYSANPPSNDVWASIYWYDGQGNELDPNREHLAVRSSSGVVKNITVAPNKAAYARIAVYALNGSGAWSIREMDVRRIPPSNNVEGRINLGSIECTTASGNVYRSDATPVPIGIVPPSGYAWQLIAQNSGGGSWAMASASSTTANPTIRFFSSVSTTLNNAYVNYSLIKTS